MKIQIKHLIYTGILMIVGTLLFKILPMYLYGEDILFDASRHIIVLSFGLYGLYYLIQNKESWRIYYAIFSAMILGVIAVQRIIVGAHNEYGVLMGFAVAGFSILFPLWVGGRLR